MREEMAFSAWKAAFRKILITQRAAAVRQGLTSRK